MSGVSLKQRILNELDQKGLSSEKIAKIAGYDSGSNLRKVLNNPEKEFGKFYGLVKIVKELFPDKEKEYMSQYALTLNPNKKTARYMLEYCDLNSLKETKEKLIEKMINCTNNESREWAILYKIDMDYVDGKITFADALNSFLFVSTKTPETRMIRFIFKLYCYLDKQMHKAIQEYVNNFDFNIIEQINDEYMKEMICSRINLIKISTLVRENRLNEARALCKEMINSVNDPTFKGWAYLHLGNSYMLEDYYKSNDYLMQGLNVTVDEHTNIRQNLKRSINFVNNLWKMNTLFPDLKSNHPADKHEIAFYYINHGQKTEARKVLESIKIEEMNENQLAFHFYLRGLLNKSIEDFSKSVTYFRKSGDLYFIKLPLLELHRSGIPDCVIESLACSA